jgi:hypothetical protein
MTHTDQARRPHKRPQRVVETADFIAFTRRILGAMSKRVSHNADHLAELAALATDVDQALVQAVAAAKAQGYSWTDIGNTLGTTRQAAQQRFGARIAGVA